MSPRARRTSGIICGLIAWLVAMAGPVTAAVFPSVAGVDFQTSGRERPPTIGDWYTSSASASTDRMHRILIEVTASQLAAAGGTLIVTVSDAESNTPNLAGAPFDEVTAPSDPTRFQLRDRTGTIVLATATFASGAANGSSATFSITAAGVYQVTSVTGAFPISGGTSVGLNDDDNSFRIDVPGSGGATGGLIGSLQGSFQQNVAPTMTFQTYFIVGPGSASLALRNFDVDGCAGCTVTYTRPSGANIAGTGSGNGVWNGAGGSLNAGQDNITGLATLGPGVNDAGVWGLRISNWSSDNQIILEAKDGGSGVNIAIYDQIPTRAGNFTITPPTTFATAIGVPVDHAFTITNVFSTRDIINLTLAGTSVNWTAQLLTSGGSPLGDTDGNGAVDSGLISAGGSVSLLLRVTPLAGAVGPDVTRIDAVSYMDTKVGASNTTRSIDKTTRLRPAIVKAFSPASIGLNGVSTLSFTLSNPNTAPSLTGVNFTDTYPAGLRNTTPLVVAGTCTGVTHTATAGGVTFNLTGANVPAAGSCTVTVQVTSAVAGSLNNVTSGVASNETGSAGAPSATATLAVNPPMTVAKTSLTLSDPANGTVNPKSIPGAFVAYNIAVSNTGTGTIDPNTVMITDAVPAQSDLIVADAGGPGSGPVVFVDGMPASGLTYSFVSLASTTDDVDFSSNGGTTYTYVPIPDAFGVDPSVTHIRIHPNGPVAAGRSFVVRFRVRIE